MKYVEITKEENHDIDFHFPDVERFKTIDYVENCVLVWSANHEQATMHIQSEIHEKAVIVWFQAYSTNYGWIIEVFKRVGNRWKLVETCKGVVRFRNYNPFQPNESTAAKNVCLSVFPSNLRKNNDAWLKHLHGV